MGKIKSKYLRELRAAQRRGKRLMRRGQGVKKMVERLEAFVSKADAKLIHAEAQQLGAPVTGSYAEVYGRLLAGAAKTLHDMREKGGALVQEATPAQMQTILTQPAAGEY